MRYPGTPLEPGPYRVPVTGVIGRLQGVWVLEAPCNLEAVGGSPRNSLDGTSAPNTRSVSALYLSLCESKMSYLGVRRCYGHIEGTAGVSGAAMPCRGPPGASCWRGRPAREVHRNLSREKCFPRIQPWHSVTPSRVVQGMRCPGTRCGPTLLQGLQCAR